MYYAVEVNMQIKSCINLAIKLSKQDNIDEICQSNKMSKQSVWDINQTNYFSTYDYILLPKSYEKVYIVKPLDTIEKISKTLGVGTDKVYCATNGKIFVGQKIFISND